MKWVPWLMILLLAVGCKVDRPEQSFEPGETTMEPRVEVTVEQVARADQPVQVQVDFQGPAEVHLVRIRRKERKTLERIPLEKGQVTFQPRPAERQVENFHAELWRGGDPLPLGFAAFSLTSDSTEPTENRAETATPSDNPQPDPSSPREGSGGQ